MQGMTDAVPEPLPIIADFDWPKVKRQEYLRVKRIKKDGDNFVELYPHQGSGVLSSASWADGLVEVFIDKEIKRGDTVNYYSFEGLI
jgi:molybdopterin molybdotransferase